MSKGSLMLRAFGVRQVVFFGLTWFLLFWLTAFLYFNYAPYDLCSLFGYAQRYCFAYSNAANWLQFYLTQNIFFVFTFFVILTAWKPTLRFFERLLLGKGKYVIGIPHPSFYLLIIFLIAIFFRLPSLGIHHSWDPAFHLYFATSITSDYPKIPLRLEGYYQGDWFEYPPLFPLALATVCKLTEPSLTCIDSGRFFVILLSGLLVFPLYLLAKQLLRADDAALAASFVYAIVPSELLADEWSVSLAILFFVLAIYLYLKGGCKNWGNRVSVGMLGGFVALAHPLEFFVLIVFMFFILCTNLIYIKKDRFGRIKNFLLFLSISLTISSFWYGPIVIREGVSFLQVSQYRVDFDVLERNDLHSMVLLNPETLWRISFILALSLVGLWHFRGEQRLAMLLCLVFSFIMSVSGYLGFYFLNQGLHYPIFLIALGSIMGGFGITVLGRNLGRMIRVQNAGSPVPIEFFCLGCLLLISAFINVFFLGTTYFGENTLTSTDLQAYYWMRQNLGSSNYIMSDYVHSLWMPYLAGQRAVTGRKLSEPRENRLETLTATVFASGNIAQAKQILQNLDVGYIYFSNHTRQNFPIVGDEDIFGKEPAVLIWKNASAGIGKFDGNCFKKMYSAKGEDDSVSIYSPADCTF